jgi:hypothetical protein
MASILISSVCFFFMYVCGYHQPSVSIGVEAVHVIVVSSECTSTRTKGSMRDYSSSPLAQGHSGTHARSTCSGHSTSKLDALQLYLYLDIIHRTDRLLARSAPVVMQGLNCDGNLLARL